MELTIRIYWTCLVALCLFSISRAQNTTTAMTSSNTTDATTTSADPTAAANTTTAASQNTTQAIPTTTTVPTDTTSGAAPTAAAVNSTSTTAPPSTTTAATTTTTAAPATMESSTIASTAAASTATPTEAASTAEATTVPDTTTTAASTTTPAPLRVSSIIMEVETAFSQSNTNSNINTTQFFDGVLQYVMNQTDQAVEMFASTASGSILGELLDENTTAVLGEFSEAITSRNRQLFFFAVLVDLEPQLDNQTVTNFFLNSTASDFTYFLRTSALLENTCEKLEAAGGSDANCTVVMTTTSVTMTTEVPASTTDVMEGTTPVPLKVSSIIEAVIQALKESQSNSDVNATELFNGVLQHVNNQSEELVNAFANTSTGSILGQILDENSTAVLGEYDSQLESRSRKIYFYGVLVDVEINIENTALIQNFADPANSSIMYFLNDITLLAGTCAKLREAGGDHPSCPVEISNQPNIALIVGCVVGGVVLLAVIAAVAYYFYNRSKTAGKIHPDSESNGRPHSVAISRSISGSRGPSSPPATPPRTAYT